MRQVSSYELKVHWVFAFSGFDLHRDVLTCSLAGIASTWRLAFDTPTRRSIVTQISNVVDHETPDMHA
jgi:hypothetical protein